MTRGNALLLVDRLTEAGYTVALRVRKLGAQGYVDPQRDPEDERTYDVTVIDLSVDKVDLRALVALADELGMDVGLSPLAQGQLRFSDAEAPHASVAGRRRPR